MYVMIEMYTKCIRTHFHDRHACKNLFVLEIIIIRWYAPNAINNISSPKRTIHLIERYQSMHQIGASQ